MGKIIQYSCDKCGTVQSEENKLELEQITVYCHQMGLEEPKILDYEYVCLNCRIEFSELVRGWAGLL